MSGAIGQFDIGISGIGGGAAAVSARPPSTAPSSEPFHIFGNDLQLSATGDLLLVGGVEETRQRILRRLLTNQGDYIWALQYGAGLPARVGQKAIAMTIAGVVRSQIFQEASVAQAPAPKITVTADAGGLVVCNIIYTDASSGQLVPLSVPLVPQLP